MIIVKELYCHIEVNLILYISKNYPFFYSIFEAGILGDIEYISSELWSETTSTSISLMIDWGFGD